MSTTVDGSEGLRSVASGARTGKFIPRDGSDEWWVECPECGATWDGGPTSNLPEHECTKRRPAPLPDVEQAHVARKPESDGLVHGVSAAFADYLLMLGILDHSNDDRRLTVDEENQVGLDPTSVNELIQVLDDLLPDCWHPMVYRGHAGPDYCAFPKSDICATCRSKGKRPPRYRPPGP